MKKGQGAQLDRKKFFADPIMVTTIVLLITFLTLFIFISHKMEEIFTICDDIVVLRDGVVTLNKSTQSYIVNL